MNQVKSFSYRKLLTAITRNSDDENNEDLLFALKTIMSTVDGIDQTMAQQVRSGACGGTV